jgi:hypothetical protein
MKNTKPNITRQEKLEKIRKISPFFHKFKGWRKKAIAHFLSLFRYSPEVIVSQDELACIAGTRRETMNVFIGLLNDIGFFESVTRYDGKYDGKTRYLYNRYVLNAAFMTQEGREIWFMLFGCLDNWPMGKDFSVCFLTAYSIKSPLKAGSWEEEEKDPTTGSRERVNGGHYPPDERQVRVKGRKTSHMQRQIHNWPEAIAGWIAKIESPPGYEFRVDPEALGIFGGSYV